MVITTTCPEPDSGPRYLYLSLSASLRMRLQQPQRDSDMFCSCETRWFPRKSSCAQGKPTVRLLQDVSELPLNQCGLHGQTPRQTEQAAVGKSEQASVAAKRAPEPAQDNTEV